MKAIYFNHIFHGMHLSNSYQKKSNAGFKKLFKNTLTQQCFIWRINRQRLIILSK